ncbi:RNA polymerase sigma factor SigF, partial [Streptomyces lydicus]
MTTVVTDTVTAPQVAAPTELPEVRCPAAVAPADARELSKQFFDRLRDLEEGTHEYQYARNTLIEMNMSMVRYVARRYRNRGDDM